MLIVAGQGDESFRARAGPFCHNCMLSGGIDVATSDVHEEIIGHKLTVSILDHANDGQAGQHGKAFISIEFPLSGTIRILILPTYVEEMMEFDFPMSIINNPPATSAGESYRFRIAVIRNRCEIEIDGVQVFCGPVFGDAKTRQLQFCLAPTSTLVTISDLPWKIDPTSAGLPPVGQSPAGAASSTDDF